MHLNFPFLNKFGKLFKSETFSLETTETTDLKSVLQNGRSLRSSLLDDWANDICGLKSGRVACVGMNDNCGLKSDRVACFGMAEKPVQRCQCYIE